MAPPCGVRDHGREEEKRRERRGGRGLAAGGKGARARDGYYVYELPVEFAIVIGLINFFSCSYCYYTSIRMMLLVDSRSVCLCLQAAAAGCAQRGLAWPVCLSSQYRYACLTCFVHVRSPRSSP